MNRTVVEKARCLLFDAGLGKKFGSETVNTAVYLRNRSVALGLHNKTPFGIWIDRKPDISDHLRIFESIIVHISKSRRLKWDKKSRRIILVGHEDHIIIWISGLQSKK